MNRVIAAVVAATVVALTCVTFALASQPPARRILVTPTMIDGTTIGSAGSHGLLARLTAGKPDERDNNYWNIGGATGLFWRQPKVLDADTTSRIWAGVVYAMDGTVIEAYYGGPLRTSKGDHLGTSLRTFLRHYPQARVVHPKSLAGCPRWTNAVITSTARVTFPAGGHGTSKVTSVFAFGMHGLLGVDEGTPGYAGFTTNSTLAQVCGG